MTARIITADCRDAMREMDADSIDAIVCDPPYSLGFMGKKWDKHDGEDAAFGYYLAGLTDGEGHFRVQEHERGTFACAFSIKLRRDDRAILEKAQRFLGVGSMVDEDRSDGGNPLVKLIVQAKADCLRVVDVFTRYPLRAKKLRDFLAWAEAVIAWNELKRGNRWHGKADWSRMDALKTAVESAREYRDPPWSGNGFQDFTREWAEEALRVLKPGGHALVFGGTRTFHRLASGLEDAGFEIRDTCGWIFGSGFPKSLDVSKAIDKAAGAERSIIGLRRGQGSIPNDRGEWGLKPNTPVSVTAPATDAARQWAGWGTALKPAWEPIILARKPLIGTVAANVMEFGTGAINIDGCRVEADPRPNIEMDRRAMGANVYSGSVDGSTSGSKANGETTLGRWPANVIHDGSDEVVALFPDTPGQIAAVRPDSGSGVKTNGILGEYATNSNHEPRGDSGSAARFFYTAKASKDDRDDGLHRMAKRTTDDGRDTPIDNPYLRGKTQRGNHHPTVKPVDLMRYLCRLVTPPGGTILDPFTGSGSTGKAALLEGFNFVGIELDPEYAAIARDRVYAAAPLFAAEVA